MHFDLNLMIFDALSDRDEMRWLGLALLEMRHFLGSGRNVPSSESSEEHVNKQKVIRQISLFRAFRP